MGRGPGAPPRSHGYDRYVADADAGGAPFLPRNTRRSLPATITSGTPVAPSRVAAPAAGYRRLRAAVEAVVSAA